ncbi:hypothetical protein CSUI_010725 [Cystoisospora suis]|uniref:Uncharacterized protein n=1 Tax=Cystoisospora suis TaxID=483139 RepID=A0A2C6KGF6_9APIC|nr:hypothetical protein CSUI_010725 [Cystoisospora suis]
MPQHAPEMPLAPQPAPPPKADSYGESTREGSRAGGKASGMQTMVEQRASAIHSEASGPAPASGHGEAQRKQGGTLSSRLSALPPDNEAPASQIVPESIRHRFPRVSTTRSTSAAVGMSDDSLGLLSVGMISLRTLGLSDISAGREALLRQAEVLSNLMKQAGVPPIDNSEIAQYAGLSPAPLAVVRGEIAQRLHDAFSRAAAATHQHGLSSREAQEYLRLFKAELRQLTAVTLLMTGHLQRT